METLSFQDAFNAAVTVGAALGGWLIRSMYDAIRDMRAADLELTERVQKIEVLVAGEYVRRDELTRVTEALFSKLDKIEAKIEAHVYGQRSGGS